MAKNSGPPQERTASMDDPLVIGMVVLGIYLLCWLAWRFGHTHIAKAYAYLRYVEFSIVYMVGEIVELPLISNVHKWVTGLCTPDGMVGLCRRDFSSVSWGEISNSTIYVNVGILLLVVFWCVKMFLKVNATHPKLKYAKAHNLKSFVNEQKSATDGNGRLLYPHLRLFGSLNMIDEPLDHPVFGMSETSKQFIFKHRLVAGWKMEGANFCIPTIDREMATHVFREQLGKHWTSSVNLSPAEAMLVAIAMPRVAATDSSLDEKDFKEALRASEDVVRFCWDQFKPPAKTKPKKGEVKADPLAWLHPEIDLTMVRKVIDAYIGHPNVQLIIKSHAFNRSVIFALFTHARRLGVLQPAEMRWLRFFDRPLWYVLETIGRQAAFAEAAGVLSHYLYEAKAGVALVEPQLDKAVTGLEVAVANFRFTAADKKQYEASAPKALTAS